MNVAFVSYWKIHAAHKYNAFILLQESMFLSKKNTSHVDDFSPRHAISRNSFAMAVCMRMVLARPWVGSSVPLAFIFFAKIKTASHADPYHHAVFL